MSGLTTQTYGTKRSGHQNKPNHQTSKRPRSNDYNHNNLNWQRPNNTRNPYNNNNNTNRQNHHNYNKYNHNNNNNNNNTAKNYRRDSYKSITNPYTPTRKGSRNDYHADAPRGRDSYYKH